MNGTINAANAGKYLYLVMAVIGPIERLMGQEAHRGRVRHHEIDELIALGTNQGVGADDDEQEGNGRDERT